MTKTELIKYGLVHESVDLDKSYESFDTSSFTTIIHLYLKNDKTISCCNCGENDCYIIGSKTTHLKSSNSIENNYLIYLHRRKFKCNVCGRVFIQNNPFSFKNTNISNNKIICVLNDLKDKNKNFTSIASEHNISKTTLLNIFDKYVDIKPHKLTEVVSFDEVYTRKLVKHNYCFIIYSPMTSTILDIIDSRRKMNLINYFSKKTTKELKIVKYVSIDLYDSYRVLAKKCFYNATICADPFHVIKNITSAFNNIRISIMNKYKDYKGENSHRYWLLKKFWKLTLKDPSKLTYDRFKIIKLDMWLSQKEILFEILKTDSILAKAYELLNEYREFNRTYNINDCSDKLDNLISMFNSFPSEYYNAIGKMLQNWRQEIINSFIKINGKRITNGFIERKNKDIKTIIRLANGFTNFTRFRNKVLYSLNDNESILGVPKTNTNKYKKKPRGKYKKSQNK